MKGSQRPGVFRVRVIDPRASSPDLIAAWADLETRALEPNGYLSPHFILPALRHLDPHLRAMALLVETADGKAKQGPRLVGAMVCHVTMGGRTFPLPRLTAYRSRHSYLSGILLDRDCADEALVALLRHIRKQRPFWHGVEFEALWGDGPTYSLLTATCDRLRIGRQEWNHSTRAVLFSQRDRAQIEAAIAAKERHLRRKLRRLQNQGQVACTLVGPCGSWAAASETFLSLEHQGWKANAGSSLRSTTGGESFFREVAAGFGREGRMVFAELRLDGKAIASSSNFASGRSGFAFKIGWQPELAKVSPGLQVELHLLREVISHQSLLPIEFWDSGAQPGSYMEGLWPSRRTVVSLAIGTTWVGQHVLRLVQTARHVRRRWRGWGGPRLR